MPRHESVSRREDLPGDPEILKDRYVQERSLRTSPSVNPGSLAMTVISDLQSENLTNDESLTGGKGESVNSASPGVRFSPTITTRQHSEEREAASPPPPTAAKIDSNRSMEDFHAHVRSLNAMCLAKYGPPPQMPDMSAPYRRIQEREKLNFGPRMLNPHRPPMMSENDTVGVPEIGPRFDPILNDQGKTVVETSERSMCLGQDVKHAGQVPTPAASTQPSKGKSPLNAPTSAIAQVPSKAPHMKEKWLTNKQRQSRIRKEEDDMIARNLERKRMDKAAKGAAE